VIPKVTGNTWQKNVRDSILQPLQMAHTYTSVSEIAGAGSLSKAYITSRKSSVVPTHIIGYGLGLLVGDYNGRQVYWHTGGAAGMVSNVCFVPEERLGIAILTNNDNQNFYGALRAQ
jgi:CubicO group peptidase (beta-lactamase class C family)